MGRTRDAVARLSLEKRRRSHWLWLVSELVLFAVVYGLLFVNFIDASKPDTAPTVFANYYHVWLIGLYFMPFIVFGLMNPDNWEIVVGLGLLSSLMNDGLWGFFNVLTTAYTPTQFWTWLCQYYVPSPLWGAACPQYLPSDPIFSIKLGQLFPVYAWEMQLSLIARAAAIIWLLRRWWKSNMTPR